jgi:hypothetical protein
MKKKSQLKKRVLRILNWTLRRYANRDINPNLVLVGIGSIGGVSLYLKFAIFLRNIPSLLKEV